MAWTIENVWQERHRSRLTDAVAEVDGIYVSAISDTHQRASTLLRFADHAGLEAEWDAGSVTTVLDAAVDSWLTSLDTTGDDQLPAGTRSGKEGYSFTS